MAFLSLNNWDVPVVNGAQMTPEEIGGDRERSVNGYEVINKIGVARRWRFKTPPLDFATSQALIGLLKGHGDTWSFEDPSGAASTNPQATITAAQSQTGKGYRTTQGTLNAANVIHTNTAADGDAVKWLVTGGSPSTYRDAAKFTSSLYACTTFANILSTNQSSADTNTTGFTAIGAASVSRVTTDYWESSGTGASIYLDISGAPTAGMDVLAAYTVGGSPVSATASAYVKGASGGEDLLVQLCYNAGGGTTRTTGTRFICPDANTWVRVFVTDTIPASQTNVGISITNYSGTPKCFVDGLQVEISDRLSNWNKGTGTVTSTGLTYPLSLMNKWDRIPLTVAAWVTGVYDASPIFQYYFNAALSGSRDSLYCGVSTTGSGYLLSEIRGDAGGTINILGGALPTKAWNHVVTTFDPKGTMYLYMNGSTATYGGSTAATTANDLKLSNIVQLIVGGGNYQGAIDDLTIYPFAMPSSMVTAYYSKTYQTPAPPFLRAVCDLIPDTYLDVFGLVTNVTQIRASSSTNYQIVDFELHEPGVI